MLPLVQTHPRVVPTNFDAFGASNSGHGVRPEQERRAIASPYHRPSTIRPFQLQYDSSTVSAGSGSRDYDYHLRRKTPRGTIDAGYDGSPTQLSPGPPPLKQLILPTPSGIYPYLPPNNIPFHAKSCFLEHEQRSLGQAPLLTSPWPVVQERPNFILSSDSSIAFQQSNLSWQSNGYPMFSQIPGMYQPLMRAAEYNVRAFCPPPASAADTATINQFGWHPGFMQPSSTQLNYGYLDSSSQFSQWFMPPGASGSFLQPQESDFQLLSLPTADLKANANVPRSSQPMLHGGYGEQNVVENASSASKQYISRSSFTEKALSQAQEHYVELLSYLQTARKFDQMTGANSNARYKVLVFPRPPKSRKINFGALQHAHGSAERSNLSTLTPNNHPQALTSNIEDTLNNNTRQQVGQNAHGEIHQPSTSVIHFGASSTTYPPSSSFDTLGPAAMAKALPILNARNSLNLLKSLCEQSYWKWIDGILLGGCLLYGLSRFEDAVEWFSRVLALDSRFDLFQMNYQVVVLYLTQTIAMLRLSQI